MFAGHEFVRRPCVIRERSQNTDSQGLAQSSPTDKGMNSRIRAFYNNRHGIYLTACMRHVV